MAPCTHPCLITKRICCPVGKERRRSLRSPGLASFKPGSAASVCFIAVRVRHKHTSAGQPLTGATNRGTINSTTSRGTQAILRQVNCAKNVHKNLRQKKFWWCGSGVCANFSPHTVIFSARLFCLSLHSKPHPRGYRYRRKTT